MRISLSTGRKRRCLDVAATAPLSSPSARYPAWYLQHWHFLPDGYLSRRSAALYETLIPRLYNALREDVVTAAVSEVARTRAVSTMLELGCGPGHMLTGIASQLPGVAVTGVDLSPFQLERAAASMAPAPSVTLVHADTASLPHTPGTFDLVGAVHLLGHMPARAAHRTLAEARRVLRPGGQVVVVDHGWHPRTVVPELRRVDERSLLGGILRLELLEPS